MSARTLFASGLACLLLVLPTAAWAHGLERHYGTPINGEHAPNAEVRRSGSPRFTLMVLETTSAALERALDEERREEVVERAQQLPRLAEELGHRAQRSGSLDKDLVALSRAAKRISTGAATTDSGTIRSDIGELRRLVRSMQEILRDEDKEQP